MNNKKYPIGIQNFETIRKDGYAYVDKTAIAHQLVKSGNLFFLNRPHRFGKSTLISTLETYFLGKKELFKGLAIEQLEQEWTARPVLHLDLNNKYDLLSSLNTILDNNLNTWENHYGACPTETTIAMRFAGIIKRAAEKSGHRVAILIDEFDKPMLQSMGNETLQQEYRSTLQSFFEVLKSMQSYTKFTLLTGVTKFGKTSILSHLDNLCDISMDIKYLSICGFTEKEIHTYFEEGVHRLAEDQKMSNEETYQALKLRYGGYRFAKDTECLYNPFSLLNAIYKMKFSNYSFEKGMPTYIVETLQRNHYALEPMSSEETNIETLNDEQPLSLIFQNGYLTIKEFDEKQNIYKLGFPNSEAEEGFFKFIMPFYTRFNKVETPCELQRFVREVERGQPGVFLKRLQRFFIDTPCETAEYQELYYRNVLFIIFKLVGLEMHAEHSTFKDGMDMLLKTNEYIYIMEFKLHGTAEEALMLIEEKLSTQSSKPDSRQMFKIGLSFSSKTLNIGRWIVE